MRAYRLNYSPGACSFAVHAVLEEIGAPFELADRTIAAGGTQTADFHQYVFTRWAWRIELPVQDWPHLAAHFERIGARPAVRRAFATERLDPVGDVARRETA